MSAPSAPDDSTAVRESSADTPPHVAAGSAARHLGGGEAELVSRLRVIEEQPLSSRAAAYASVHEELAKRLESAPPDERG